MTEPTWPLHFEDVIHIQVEETVIIRALNGDRQAARHIEAEGFAAHPAGVPLHRAWELAGGLMASAPAHLGPDV